MRALVTGVVLGLLLTGCGSTPDETAARPAEPSSIEQSVSPAAPTPTPSATTARQAVPSALRFEAKTVGGQTFDGASLVGKPTLLWFWAPWCPTCRSQIPQVEDIAKRFGERVNVVGVGSLDDARAIAQFADDVAGPTHLTDEDGSVWKRFGVVQQSSFVLLDASGKRVFDAGYGGADDLEDRVSELVG